MEEEEKIEEEQQEEQEKQEEKKVEVPAERPAEKRAERKVSFPKTRRERRKTGKMGKRVLILIIVVIVLGGAGWLIFVRPKTEEKPEPTPEIFVEEASPTPTTEPINREDIKIEVLNGTGIPEEAAYLQEQLEDLGYSNVELGNADEQDFVTTLVTFGESVSEAVKDEVTEKLKGIYQDVDTRTASLEEKDIQVITGYKEGYTPTPTPTTGPASTPTPTATVSATPTSSPTPTPP